MHLTVTVWLWHADLVGDYHLFHPGGGRLALPHASCHHLEPRLLQIPGRPGLLHCDNFSLHCHLLAALGGP